MDALGDSAERPVMDEFSLRDRNLASINISILAVFPG